MLTPSPDRIGNVAVARHRGTARHRTTSIAASSLPVRGPAPAAARDTPEDQQLLGDAPSEALEVLTQKAGKKMRYPKRTGQPPVPGRRVRLATAALLLVTMTTAACGDSPDDDAKASAPKAPATIPELTKDPLTLSFIWFEWPPAQALEAFANKEYKQERPNATIKVNTVPNANWHDAMFTQFAARKTDFDIAILDSQHIGEAVTNGNILDITDFVKQNIDTSAYNPYLLAAYGQYPQAETGQRDESASLYGLPLLGDTWTMIYRKDLIGDTPPKTWDEMISVAAKCQADNPGVSGLAFHQANGSDDA